MNIIRVITIEKEISPISNYLFRSISLCNYLDGIIRNYRLECSLLYLVCRYFVES